MKIQVEFDGSCATCAIVDKWGKEAKTQMQFSYADKITQLQVLDAFRCIEAHFERELNN